MRSIKYLNTILTVIAFCLLVITMNLLGFNPAANAKDSGQRYTTVPLNPDGSITVKIAAVTDVNIKSCDEHAFYNAEPISVKISDEE